MMDFQRTAREHSLAYQHPDKFPIATVAAARTAWWVKEHNDASIKNKTEDFIDAMFHAYYVDNQDISDANKVLELAGSVGLDKSAVEAALQDQAVKDRLKQAVEDAIELKIFGSPMMRVDGELFWGSDRIDQIDRWLSVGGW